MSKQSNRLIKRFNLESGIVASIWENQTDKGKQYAVNVERRYKDGGEWKSSNNYFGAQNLVAAKAHEIAYEYIATELRSPSVE